MEPPGKLHSRGAGRRPRHLTQPLEGRSDSEHRVDLGLSVVPIRRE